MPRGKKQSKEIKTVEQEIMYMNSVWNRLETLEKVAVITFTFLFFYLIIVTLASYSSLTKSADPSAGKAVFWLMAATAFITMLPVAAHYTGISTYGIIHIMGMAGVITFITGLWILFEMFDKRELESKAYKDPYTIAIYFLLVSFSVIYVVASISRKF